MPFIIPQCSDQLTDKVKKVSIFLFRTKVKCNAHKLGKKKPERGRELAEEPEIEGHLELLLCSKWG